MEQQTTPPQPSLPPVQDVDEIKNNLNLLGIFHYVLGGISIFMGLFPMMYIVMGILSIVGIMPMESSPGHADKTVGVIFGIVFIVIGAIGTLFAESVAILTLTNGGRLRKQRRYTLTLVTAAMECIMFPFGTLLGVFTLIIMTKPQAKAMFQSQDNRQS